VRPLAGLDECADDAVVLDSECDGAEADQFGQGLDGRACLGGW